MREEKYRTDLMRPIVPVDQFNKLREAGLIWFDFTMSEGNMYGFHPAKIVEMYEELEFIKREYGKALPSSLTRDALTLKITVLEQKLKAVKQVIDECKDTMIKDAILNILEG